MGLFSKLFGKNKKSKKIADQNQEVDTKVAASEEMIVDINEKNVETSPAEEMQEPNDVKPTKTATKKPQGTKAKETNTKEAAKKEAKETKEDKEATFEPAPAKKEAYTGRYEIKKSKDGRFVFNLFAANSVIVATSQIYSSSQAALNGIKSIQANGAKAPIEDNTLKEKVTLPFPKWEIYSDKAGQYRFRLYASNGSCVVHSQGYTTKSSCKNGIDSIIRCSKNPLIDKAYLKKEEK
jgi:uncharacterized protein YegP (UPF0339 family)